MEIKPVINYSRPKYPNFQYFADNPGLLGCNVPKRWRLNKMTYAALIAFAVNLPNTGCTSFKKYKPNKELLSNQDKTNNDKNSLASSSKNMFKVAPVFVHGDGSGADGCLSIRHPVFISEDMAREIITEEFSLHGIRFNKIKVAIQEISKEQFTHIKKVDAVSDKFKIGYEFISSNSECSTSEHGDSFVGYHTKFYAEKTYTDIKDKVNLNMGIFYDPMTNSKKESVENLKGQVDDFINWLYENKIVVDD